MSLNSANCDDIKRAIFDELTRTLLNPGPDPEERLKQLKYTEGYGIYLCEIALNLDLDLGLRQLAAVMLKQYVDSHWAHDEDDNDDPYKLIATPQAKQAIKTLLPNGLHDINSKIRKSVAYTISSIASHDWPSDWIELFDIIVKCLAGNESSIHGAMSVLVEFTYELEGQVKEVGPIILSEVYRIFEAENVYSVKTRSVAVEILKSLLKCITTHIDSKQEQANLLNPILPLFMQKMVQGLTIPNGPLSSFTLKKEILKVLTYMLAEMPVFIIQFMPQILPPIWQLLTQMADIYINYIVNESDPNPFNDTVEDEKNQFIEMILQIFEFIHSIAESKKFKSYVKDVTGDLVYVLILYMQMTEEQIEVWSEDAEKFVEDEDEEGTDYSIRTSGQDILMRLGEEFEEKLLQGLTDALTKHVAVADADRNAGKPFWWKIHEASMLAVGSFKDLILEHEDKFNLQEYLNLVKNLVPYQVSPFLLGRCVWVMSKYIETDVCRPHFGDAINTTIDCMGANKDVVLRISAIRSIYAFCSNLKAVESERKDFLVTKLGIFLDGILQIIPLAQNTVLGLVLETLSEMLSFDTSFTSSSSQKCIPMVLALLLKFNDDRFILEHVLEILKIWSQNPYCLQPLQVKLVPTLVSIFNLQGEQVNSSMQETALDVLETIVKYSKKPLSDALIESAFPAAVHCILRSEDNSVMQSGGECMRAFLHVSPEQVCNYKNGEGLNSILQITTMLLNPMSVEYSAAFIGRLVITLITKAGNFLGDHIDLLLKAVISKMQLVESLNVNMSLVMIFAHLFLIQMDAVMNFLSTVPGPTGEPAMNFVFHNWLSRQHLFYGTYERKVSILSLCKIFEFGVTMKDSRLTSVMIKDLIEMPSSTGKVNTRSQASNQQWHSIPILVKIFKLLINELSNLREFREAMNNSQGDDEDGSDDENVDLDASVCGGKNLNAMMLFDDEDTTEDDNQLLIDLQQDPIFQEDTEQSLKKFILNFSQNENFGAFMSELSPAERKLLENLEVVKNS